MTYKYEWWRLTHPHTFYDTKQTMWNYPRVLANPGGSVADEMKLDQRLWLSDLRRGGSLGIEPAFTIIPPEARNRLVGPDAPRPQLIRTGAVRFARKADLMMFKLTYG